MLNLSSQQFFILFQWFLIPGAKATGIICGFFTKIGYLFSYTVRKKTKNQRKIYLYIVKA